jgi:Fic-DOC domain mobile mystery protein B
LTGTRLSEWSVKQSTNCLPVHRESSGPTNEPLAPLPGETPIEDVSGLKIRSITNRGELNLAEAENIRHTVVKYLLAKPSRRSARFDLAWSKRLHREMFGRVWRWAGEIRHTNLNIGIEHYHVEITLQMLLDDLNFWGQHATVGIIEQTVMLHHRAVQIHPFLNGNGRWARMLANVWCKLQVVG